MSPDHDRLQSLLDRLCVLELRIPMPHERAIHEVAQRALAEQIRALSQCLQRGAYWRPPQASLAS